MYGTTERVRRVRLRITELRRKRENRLMRGLCSLCAVLAFSLIRVFSLMSGAGQDCIVPGFYGTMLLDEDAGGYVLVGVLSFSAAVVITVLCIRYRAKSEKHNKNDKEGGRVK